MKNENQITCKKGKRKSRGKVIKTKVMSLGVTQNHCKFYNDLSICFGAEMSDQHIHV